MATQIYVNLPVKDLDRSVAFFTKLGYTFNPQFTNANATCMIVGENIFVMLLVEKFFKTFTPNEFVTLQRAPKSSCACRQRAARKSTRPTHGCRGRRPNTPGGARPRLHVWSWIPGSGRPHLGTGVHATARDAVITPTQLNAAKLTLHG